MDAAGLPGGAGCPFREAADTGTAVTASAGAIGNNLNQTARKVNSGQWSSGDRVQVVAALIPSGMSCAGCVWPSGNRGRG